MNPQYHHGFEFSKYIEIRSGRITNEADHGTKMGAFTYQRRLSKMRKTHIVNSYI